MSDVIRASKTGGRDDRQRETLRAPLPRGDWTPRGAIVFWIAVSGIVWIALAASAVWVY